MKSTLFPLLISLIYSYTETSESAVYADYLDDNKDDLKFTSHHLLSRVFSSNDQINKCHQDLCRHCCLSNTCGTFFQCKQSDKAKFFLDICFSFVLLILVLLMIYKIYITSPYKDQTETDKIDEATLEELIIIFKERPGMKRKFKFD